jgi:enamine deaminase RidA (YjgF/YER057c/UK114 family)
MDIERIDAGPRMSEAVIYNGVIYTSGVVADTTVGQSVYEQTKDILAQIDEILAKAGSDKSRLLKANIWLTDMASFSEMNRAWDAWVIPGQTPARATVESKLAAKGYDVEIMIEAAA